MQAAGTRFSLIYSAAGRYGASQIHFYFRQRYNFFINLQFFQIFLINQPYCLHKTVISMWLLVKLCQFGIGYLPSCHSFLHFMFGCQMLSRSAAPYPWMDMCLSRLSLMRYSHSSRVSFSLIRLPMVEIYLTDLMQMETLIGLDGGRISG